MRLQFPFFRRRAGKAVLLFVKFPEQGKVKTRLASVLGEAKTLELYRNFVLDVLDVLRGADARCQVWYHPESAKKEMKRWLGDNYEYYPQKGEDLGQRMKNAFKKAFRQGYREAVLVGSDIPDLTPGIIGDAFSELDSHDSVMGPAQDGGYYLIGFGRDSFYPALFDGIRWSGPGVFDGTMHAMESAGATVGLLPELSDIDTIYDLRKYFERARHTGSESSRTFRYLLGQ